MNKMSKFCGICDGNIQESTWEDHKVGKDHVKNVQQKEHTIILEKKNSWQQITRNDIIYVFSKFGPIVKFRSYSKPLPPMAYAQVEFTKAEVVNKVLEMNFYKIHGQLVRVKRWISEKQDDVAMETEQQEASARQKKENQYLQDMYKSIKMATATDDQIRQLAWMQDMPQADHTRAQELRCELEKIIRAYIPEAKVFLVGSVCSGLGIRGSDVNLEVELDPKAIRQPSLTLLPAPPKLPSALVKQMNLEVRDGRIEYSHLMKDRSLLDILWLLYEILDRSPLSENIAELALGDSQESFSKRNKIWFRDRQQHLLCVIGVKFGTSLHKHVSRAIKTLTQLDERVRLLYIAVRFWATQLGLMDTFSSYGIFLLVYMYLQNTKPPILPSIDTLSMMSSDKTRAMVGSIDVSLCIDVTKIRQQCLMSQNTQSLSQLLQGFFKFYAKFEMSNRVFCPRSGRSYNMLKFRNMKKAISNLASFNLRDRCFHIQDLFRVNYNIVIPTPYIDKHRVSLEFLRAATIVRDRVDVDWHLLSVFPMKTINSQMDSILQKAPIVIPFDAVLLPDGFLAYSSYSEAERHWYQWVVELTMKVLQLLRIEYELEGDFGVELVEGKRQLPDELNSNKRFKTEGDRVIHAADRNAAMNFEMCFEADRHIVQETRLQCTDTKELWKKRPCPSKHYWGVTKDLFAHEEKVSLRQLGDGALPSGQMHKFILVMQHVKTANESQIEMGVESIGEDFSILTFMTFFQEFVMRLVCKEVGLDVTYLAAKFKSS